MPISETNLLSHKATHAQLETLATITNKIKERLQKEGDKPEAPLQAQLALVDELSAFEFGRFLMLNGGLNGFWTQYMVLYPQWKKTTATPLHPLEQWLLEKAPIILATQERFLHFQTLLQKHLKDNMVLASLPCGMMDDLLTLDFSKVNNIKLVGIDLDSASLIGATQQAAKYHLSQNTSVIQKDAWGLEIQNEFDILTSNGLNIYEPNDEKIKMLYQKFYAALKPNGLLITSFLTPPPTLNANSPWDMTKINTADLQKQKVIFSYISAKFTAFRGEEETKAQLKQAGFRNIEILYDKAKLFPTVIAAK